MPISSISDNVVIPNVITVIPESSIFPQSHVSDFIIPHSFSSVPSVIHVPFTDSSSSTDFASPISRSPLVTDSVNLYRFPPLNIARLSSNSSLPLVRKYSRIRKTPSYLEDYHFSLLLILHPNHLHPHLQIFILLV